VWTKKLNIEYAGSSKSIQLRLIDDNLKRFSDWRTTYLDQANCIFITINPTKPAHFSDFQYRIRDRIAYADPAIPTSIIITHFDLVETALETNPAYYEEILRNITLIEILANKLRTCLFYNT
jgi:uncharacterized membrane protein